MLWLLPAHFGLTLMQDHIHLGSTGHIGIDRSDERTTWLVVTRWRDESSFQTWLHSPAFGHGHRSAAERSGGEAPPPACQER